MKPNWPLARLQSTMRRLIPAVRVLTASVATLAAAAIVAQISSAQVSVRGYWRRDGTYVQPHVRTHPDGNPYNNDSFPGNYNPNTGKITPGNPATYLHRYYSRQPVPSLTEALHPLEAQVASPPLDLLSLSSGKTAGGSQHLDLSPVTNDERTFMEAARSYAKYLQDLAAYNRRLSSQLRTLTSRSKPPTRSRKLCKHQEGDDTRLLEGKFVLTPWGLTFVPAPNSVR